MKKILSIYCMLLLCVSMQAGDGGGMVSTSQTGGRYEIIQSNVLRELLFKLDKYTGEVYQYVKYDTGIIGNGWEKVAVLMKMDEIKDPTKINYQLFMSGLSAGDCFLLNINNGNTYRLFKDKKDNKIYFSKVAMEEVNL